MDYRVHLNLATTATIVVIGLGVSLVTSTLVASRAYQHRGDTAAQREQTITVKGSTRRRVQSDRAVWYVTIRGENRDLREALAALDSGVQRVRGFLTQRGFQPDEVRLGAIDTNTHYVRDAKGNETRELMGYTLARSFVLSTTDVSRVASSAGDVTQLMQEGLVIVSLTPEYYITRLPDLRADLLGEAAKDARRRADEIARNVGGRVADVRSVQMGVLQVTRPDSTEVSDYGRYETETVDKDVQAVVTVAFRIEST